MNLFQAIEQMTAALRDISPALMSYYNNLKKEGFTDEQAFELVKEFQASIFTTPPKS